MITRFQALLTTMATIGDDPVVLSYFVPAMDTMIDDIKDEIFEAINIIIPEIEEEEDPPIEDPPSTDPPIE
jgi:hypothetical protein